MGWGIIVASVWSAALTVTDLRRRRLPDALTLPAVGVVAVSVVTAGQWPALFGGAGWFLLCVVPGLVSTRWRVGGGDAKLSLSLGTVAAAVGGVTGWFLAVGGASVVTLLLSPVPTLRKERTVPHGPGMILATWIACLLTM